MRRRVPLRSTVGLRRTRAPERRTAIRPVSPQRRREQRVRREAMVAEFGAEPLCARCGRRADDAHEPGMRSRGADPTKPEHCIPLCRACHSWTHENPRAATERGLLVPSWVKDKTQRNKGGADGD